MNIRLVSPTASNARAWAAALSRSGGHDVSTLVKRARDLPALANGTQPELVIVEAIDASDISVIENLVASQEDVDVVVVSADLEPDTLMRLMRAGVREVLPAPASADALQSAVSRVARKRPSLSVLSELLPEGKVLAFASCKGGSGATFVAANAAYVLAAGGERSVALIDANMQFGDAMLFVSNETPQRNLVDVCAETRRLDREFLRSAMTCVAPGLWVLASPDDPAQAAGLQPENFRAVLRVAKDSFDYVVVDVGRGLSPLTLPVLDMAERIYAVLQLTLPFIRDSKRLRDVFSSLDYPASKICWLVNRYEKNNELTLDDLKRTLKVHDVSTLPNQYQLVATSVNQGVPVEKLSPGSPIAKALRELMAKVAPPARASKRGSGWLAGLLRLRA